MYSHLRATLCVDVGNDLHVVFGVEPFEAFPKRFGMRLGHSAWDAIAKLRLKLTRRPVSRRSSVSFIIHSSLPQLTTAHWVILPAINVVHPRQHRPCVSRTHTTHGAPTILAQMDIFKEHPIAQPITFPFDSGLRLALIVANGWGVEW